MLVATFLPQRPFSDDLLDEVLTATYKFLEDDGVVFEEGKSDLPHDMHSRIYDRLIRFRDAALGCEGKKEEMLIAKEQAGSAKYQPANEFTKRVSREKPSGCANLLERQTLCLKMDGVRDLVLE